MDIVAGAGIGFIVGFMIAALVCSRKGDPVQYLDKTLDLLDKRSDTVDRVRKALDGKRPVAERPAEPVAGEAA